MDWVECFLSLITLVETISEAQFSTWHLSLSFCLVLLVKQVWNCHQHPDQFTCCAILGPDIWRIETLPSKLKFSFSLSPSNTWPWLEGKEKNPQILATCSSNLWALNSQSLFIFCFKKWLCVLLGVTPVLRTELLDHVMWLNSLTPSLCSLWHQ